MTMLFAGSKPEIQSILGLQEQKPIDLIGNQERNQICSLSYPPKCVYEDELYGPFGNTFEQSESGGITNKIFDKSLTREGGFKPPLPGVDMDIREILRRNEEKFKAEVPETWNEGTGIEKGGYENAPQWLRDQLWKQDLRKRQELGLEPVVS
jgi:hypothetical protein